MRLSGVIAAFALIQFAGPAAQADEYDTLNAIAGVGTTHDSNIFHLPSGAPPAQYGATKGTGDTIVTEQVGVQMDKTWSLQRVKLDVNLARQNFQEYSYLDSTNNNYDATWFWGLTPWVKGTLSATQQQALVNYSDFRNLAVRNVHTNRDQHFDVDGALWQEWHVGIGATHHQTVNDVTFTAEDQYSLNSAELSGSWVAPSGSTIKLLYRSGAGHYPNRVPDPFLALDNEFSQRELLLIANWQVTGKSQLQAQIGELRRTYSNFAIRNFSGAEGRLAYAWIPTGKLQIATSFERILGDYEDNFLPYYSSSYERVDRLTVRPAWAISARMTARATLQEVRTDFRGPVFALPFQRADREHVLGAGLEWAPWRALVLAADLQRDQRSSSVEAFSFQSTGITFNAQLVF